MLQRRQKVAPAGHKRPLLTLAIASLLWLGAAAMVYFVDPRTTFALPLFLLLIFAALFLTTATLLQNSRRAILVSATIIIFLTLRYFGIGNILNLLLLAGVAVCAELYFLRR